MRYCIGSACRLQKNQNSRPRWRKGAALSHLFQRYQKYGQVMEIVFSAMRSSGALLCFLSAFTHNWPLGTFVEAVDFSSQRGEHGGSGGAGTYGCYDITTHDCSCSEALCSEGGCSSANGMWTDGCTSCHCKNVAEGDHNEDHGGGSDGASQSGAIAVASGGGGFQLPTAEENAAIARWAIQEASWGTVTTSGAGIWDQQEAAGTNPPGDVDDAGESLSASIQPIADHSGRVFLYLKGMHHLHDSSLTVSQAGFHEGSAGISDDLFAVAGCGSLNGAVDAQDPRCAKVTLTGSIHPCSSHDVGADCEEVGTGALFVKHPALKGVTQKVNYFVHELVIADLWMIANFGGARPMDIELYFNAIPAENEIVGGVQVVVPVVDYEEEANSDDACGPWGGAARARWIVHRALWTTLSTLHGKKENESAANSEESQPPSSSFRTFGNIRSVHDGGSVEASNGKPIFNVPDVDPSAVDMAAGDGKIVLTFSEASIAGAGGMPPPVVTNSAQVALHGRAVALPDKSDSMLAAFARTHPLGGWLAQGGSHMSGKYYTIDIDRVVLVLPDGSAETVDVADYLGYPLVNRAICSFSRGSVAGGLDVTTIVSWTLFGFALGVLAHAGCTWRRRWASVSSGKVEYENISATANGAVSYKDHGLNADSHSEEGDDRPDEINVEML